VPGQYT